MLALDVKQLLVVADYQLLEAAEMADGDSAAAAADVLKTRIPLLIRCLANDRHKTRAVVDYLVEKITDPEEEYAEEENKGPDSIEIFWFELYIETWHVFWLKVETSLH